MSRRRQDGHFDGVRQTMHPRRAGRRLWMLLAVVVLAAGVGWRMSDHRAAAANARADGGQAGANPAGTDRSPDPSPAAVAGTRGGQGAPPVSGTPSPARDGEDPTPDLSDYVLPGDAPSMAQVIEALHARGIRTGLGAFQPPGTSPPLRGLEVPDDFPLPDGYVRHHQATDDGQRVAPILMFAPDRETIVVRGVRVPVPANRVVPPELAPPGLPLRWVRIPPPRDGGGRS